HAHLYARGRVADHRVEPDVDPLALVLLVARYRDPDSPVEVPGDRPGLQIVNQVLREAADVGTPVVLARDPLAEPVGERRKVEKEVVRLAEDRRQAVDAGARVDQVDWVELAATGVATGPRAAPR